MKLRLDSLVVEVTRRCNMACAHCMRGDAQNQDLDIDKIDAFLENVKSVNSITFTGGEPTLNVSAMKHVLETCKAKQIEVFEFYVVTNGKDVPDGFIITMIEWYMYCLQCSGCELEYSGVTLSRDMFHDDIDDSNIDKLRALSFFLEQDKAIDFRRAPVQNRGRAKSITDKSVEKREPNETSVPEVEIVSYDGQNFINVIDGVLTFTCTGDILIDCDYEYESTDDIKIGDYTNLPEELLSKLTSLSDVA